MTDLIASLRSAAPQSARAKLQEFRKSFTGQADALEIEAGAKRRLADE
ncbi:hypothetical protein [Bradyrhizobium sp. USDA 3364]